MQELNLIIDNFLRDAENSAESSAKSNEEMTIKMSDVYKFLTEFLTRENISEDDWNRVIDRFRYYKIPNAEDKNSKQVGWMFMLSRYIEGVLEIIRDFRLQNARLDKNFVEPLIRYANRRNIFGLDSAYNNTWKPGNMDSEFAALWVLVKHINRIQDQFKFNNILQSYQLAYRRKENPTDFTTIPYRDMVGNYDQEIPNRIKYSNSECFNKLSGKEQREYEIGTEILKKKSVEVNSAINKVERNDFQTIEKDFYNYLRGIDYNYDRMANELMANKNFENITSETLKSVIEYHKLPVGVPKLRMLKLNRTINKADIERFKQYFKIHPRETRNIFEYEGRLRPLSESEFISETENSLYKVLKNYQSVQF